MSYVAIEWCRPFKIQGWPKAVLFCLAEHHNDKTGRCDPSLTTIGKEMGCSEQTARRAIRWLAAQGYIILVERIGKPALVALRLEGVYPCHGDTPTGGIPLPPSNEPLPNEGQTPTTQSLTPATVVPKPLEPSMKPLEPMRGAGDVEQTNGHDRAPLGLGLIPDEHLAANGADRCACDHAKDAWNAIAERCGWPRVQRLAPPRAKALEARLKEIGGLPEWQKMLSKMEGSPFFRERWQPSFDWVLKPANLTKIVEGNYDPKAKNGTASSTDPWQQRLRGYKPGGFWNPMWGEPPESGHCAAPADLLAQWREA